jgi:hypothetical protein
LAPSQRTLFPRKRVSSGKSRYIGPDDPREAAAIREIDLQRKYPHSRSELAKKLKINTKKAKELRDRADCCLYSRGPGKVPPPTESPADIDYVPGHMEVREWNREHQVLHSGPGIGNYVHPYIGLDHKADHVVLV